MCGVVLVVALSAYAVMKSARWLASLTKPAWLTFWLIWIINLLSLIHKRSFFRSESSGRHLQMDDLALFGALQNLDVRLVAFIGRWEFLVVGPAFVLFKARFWIRLWLVSYTHDRSNISTIGSQNLPLPIRICAVRKLGLRIVAW